MGNFKPYEPPKEPVYEYLVIYKPSVNSHISTRFFTEEAKEAYGYRFIELVEWSKRKRK